MTNDQQKKTIDARVKCENCGRGARLADTLVTRPVFGIANATEVGIRCPHCRHYRRAYWDTPSLHSFRLSLKEAAQWAGAGDAGAKKYRQAKTRYNAEFDRLQAQIAQRLGQPLPNAEDHLGAEIAIKIAETKEEAQT